MAKATRVSSGVTAVDVVAIGAPGGGGTVIMGGRGAVVSADVPIPEGQTLLYVEVGGAGVGFNGGGDGNYAGGDAGSSGNGGGLGGNAGTATAGGDGGQGNPPETCTNGQPGSLGQGGNGAAGGGGGGYYGGGSGGLIGGPNCGSGSYETPGGGGGGGSSYATSQATQVTFGLDDSRTPQITITPVVATPITPIVTTPTPITLSNLSVTPPRFVISGRRVNTRCQPETATNRTKPRCTRAIALRIFYVLTGPAKVSFEVTQDLAGRVVGGHYRAATHANRLRHRCTLLVPRGSFTQGGTAGQNAIQFNGRLGSRLLCSGAYVLTATVAGISGSTGTRSASFRVTS